MTLRAQLSTFSVIIYEGQDFSFHESSVFDDVMQNNEQNIFSEELTDMFEEQNEPRKEEPIPEKAISGRLRKDGR